MSTADSSPSQDLVKNRYGKSRQNNFTGKILVIAFAVMMIAAGVYMVAMISRTGEAKVTAVETGGSIISDTKLTSQIDVTRDDPSQPAYCIITALDYSKAEVGRREVVIPAETARISRISVDINTRQRAHAAKVYGCSTTIPPHLKH